MGNILIYVWLFVGSPNKGVHGLSPRVGSGKDSPCSAPHRFAERLVVPLRYTARPCISGGGARPASIIAGQACP